MGGYASIAWLLAMHAVDAATQKWMGWTISCTTSSQYGIPRGLPYLTGFVIQSGIDTELEAA